MSPRIAVDENAFKNILSHMSNSAAFVLKYGMLDDELSSILNSPLTENEMAILSGMLSSRQIKGLKGHELISGQIGKLLDTREEYLGLGICCSHCVIFDTQPTPRDLATLVSNGVSTNWLSMVNFVALAMSSSNRVINTWSFVDGGSETPLNTIYNAFRSAKSIVVYDKYFKHASLRMLEDVLVAMYNSHGALTIDLKILCGSGLSGGLTFADVVSALGHLFDSPNRVMVEKCKRATHCLMDAHDRYIQIDNRRSLIFPTGTAIFYEANGGLNRAGQIFEVDIVDSYSVVDLVEISSNSQVSVRF